MTVSHVWRVLKVAPAALLVLLALLWLGSISSSIGYSNHRWGLFAREGRATLQIVEGSVPRGGPVWRTRSIVNRPPFGSFGHRKVTANVGNLPPYTYHDYDVPISFLMLFLLPIAVGCVTRFQFRLWMYFVFVALVAICVMSCRVA